MILDGTPADRHARIEPRDVDIAAQCGREKPASTEKVGVGSHSTSKMAAREQARGAVAVLEIDDHERNSAEDQRGQLPPSVLGARLAGFGAVAQGEVAETDRMAGGAEIGATNGVRLGVEAATSTG